MRQFDITYVWHASSSLVRNNINRNTLLAHACSGGMQHPQNHIEFMHWDSTPNVEKADEIKQLMAKLQRAQSDYDSMPADLKQEVQDEDNAFKDMLQQFSKETMGNPMTIEDSSSEDIPNE